MALLQQLQSESLSACRRQLLACFASHWPCWLPLPLNHAHVRSIHATLAI
jgi:hypothetical protein